MELMVPLIYIISSAQTPGTSIVTELAWFLTVKFLGHQMRRYLPKTRSVLQI